MIKVDILVNIGQASKVIQHGDNEQIDANIYYDKLARREVTEGDNHVVVIAGISR